MHDETNAILAFSDYWLSKAKDGRLPSYRQILPEEIFRLLPNLAVFQVIDDGADFLCRIVGESLADNYGAQDKGRLLSEIIAGNPSLAVFRRNFLRALATRRPLMVVDRFLSEHETPKQTIGIVAPLSDDGQSVTHLICCGVYVDTPGGCTLDARLPEVFERIENVA